MQARPIQQNTRTVGACSRAFGLGKRPFVRLALLLRSVLVGLLGGLEHGGLRLEDLAPQGLDLPQPLLRLHLLAPRPALGAMQRSRLRVPKQRRVDALKGVARGLNAPGGVALGRRHFGHCHLRENEREGGTR